LWWRRNRFTIINLKSIAKVLSKIINHLYKQIFSPLGHQPMTRASMESLEELNLLMSTVFIIDIITKSSFIM